MQRTIKTCSSWRSRTTTRLFHLLQRQAVCFILSYMLQLLNMAVKRSLHTPGPCQSSSWSHLWVLVLRLGWKAGGVLLSPLHTHQLHLRLSEGGDEAGQQRCDGQGVREGQTHQTWQGRAKHITELIFSRHVATKPGSGLTRIDRLELMLDDCESPEAGYHGDADQLQADVQPLHGGFAEEPAALVLLQTPGVLLHKPAAKKLSSSVTHEEKKPRLSLKGGF